MTERQGARHKEHASGRSTGRRVEPPAQGLAERREAVRLIGTVLDWNRMLDEVPGAGDPGLSGPERAAARGLADLTLRRLGQIDDVLSRFAKRQPPAPANHLLRAMTAELVFAGTQPHAAVDTAVRLARSHRATAGLAGLVNALGRRIASDGAAIAAVQDAAELNTPGWLAARLVADWGPDTARDIAEAHLVAPPHDLTPKWGAEPLALAEMLGEVAGADVLPTGSIRLAGRPQVTALPGFAEGQWWLQDAAAALPARLIPEPAGKAVLDLCAAPGGKTLQLAAMGAKVTALDVSERRLERLTENLARTMLDARTVAADALDWSPERKFDAILLDAPCSASGTIRRHPDMPWRTDPDRLEALTALQDRLLARAWEWLRPGGTLVYCTCSVLKAESEARVDAFLAGHSDARLEAVEGIPAEFVDARGYFRSRPDQWAARGHIDGFFAARLDRV